MPGASLFGDLTGAYTFAAVLADRYGFSLSDCVEFLSISVRCHCTHAATLIFCTDCSKAIRTWLLRCAANCAECYAMVTQ